jgi:hypothetical protein
MFFFMVYLRHYFNCSTLAPSLLAYTNAFSAKTETLSAKTEKFSAKTEKFLANFSEFLSFSPS